MQKTFGRYADYYDLIYQDKDYHRECDYIESLWRRFGKTDVRSVLNVGCGTGGHDILLAERGYEVHGLDRSIEMVEIASEKAGKRNLNINFINQDIIHFQSDRKFDAVISMFATMGYLTSNENLIAGMKNIRSCLDKGGLFLFDLWYGPAVLAQRPETRMKPMTIEGEVLYRLALPSLDSTRNAVDVEYIIIHPSRNLEVRELHRMRYFFVPELEWMADQGGFSMIGSFAFLSEREPPSLDSWNITCVLGAV
ncbi:MAG: class I SAM-dependent methyltransferase [Desulfobacteraceae bacterium]|nr:MAG: class I SAM-dependent methyltransferase [Desulfobacteraceae bacterium]